MNTIIKRMLAFILSFILIFCSVTSANAISSWSVTKAVNSGSRVIVNATNGGYKSAVNISPNLLKVAKYGLKGANLASWAFAAASLLPDGVDFVLDPENNRIKYKDSKAVGVQGYYVYFSIYSTGYHASLIDACNAFGVLYFAANFVSVHESIKSGNECLINATDKKGEKVIYTLGYIAQGGGLIVPDSYAPISDIAPKLIANAQAGNVDAKKLLVDVAVAAVVAGDYDADLLAGAVPINETKPVIPAVPGSQVGDVDAGMTGGDVGAAADAAREAADAAKKSADAARDVYDDAVKDAAKAAADAKDLINQAIDQAIKDAAAVAAAEAAKVAADAKSVYDAAVLAAAEAAKVAADKAVAAAEKSAADARAAADATVESIAAADKAVADAKAAAKEAKEAAKEAKEAAKADAKPFELPAFCSWATPVCDAVDWLMKPAPDLGDDSILDIDTDNVLPVDTDINFGGSCPANFEFSGSMFGNPINIVLLDTSKFCGFLSTFVKFPVYAASSLFALYILGGRKDV